VHLAVNGRKRPLISLEYWSYERPLWRKADISGWVLEIGLTNDRFPPRSGH
jgi:hypothetical protein